MSIGSWVVLGLVVIVATGYFVVTQTKEDIARRTKWGRPEQEEIGLIEAFGVLGREAVAQVRKLLLVQERYKHKPVRKHSARHLGSKGVRVTTLQTVCGR